MIAKSQATFHFTLHWTTLASCFINTRLLTGRKKIKNVMKNRSESFYSLRPKIIERILRSWKITNFETAYLKNEWRDRPQISMSCSFWFLLRWCEIWVMSGHSEIWSVKIGKFSTFWKPFNNFGTEGVWGK